MGFLAGIRFRVWKPMAVISNGMSATVLALLARGRWGWLDSRALAVVLTVVLVAARGSNDDYARGAAR